MSNDKKPIDPIERQKITNWIAEGLSVPPRMAGAYNSIDDVREAFAPPVTLVGEEARNKVSVAFDNAGGYEAIFNSLTQHAMAMGQYPMAGFLGYPVLESIQQNGMIQNCIKTVADDVTREWIEVTGGEETEDGRTEKLQDLQENKYKLRRLFNEAQTLTGFLGGCFIYIDTDPNGDDPEHDPSLPLAISSRSSELEEGSRVAFRVIDPVNVCPSTFNASDPLKKDYMKPRSWMILGQEVHSSRLLRIVDNEPPTLYKPAYNFLGIPQAQILWDYVLHWNECRVAGAELLKKISLLVYKTNARELLSTVNGVEHLDTIVRAVQRYRDNDSVFVCDSEDDVINIQTSVGGISDLIRQAQECISAVNRTPAVKLFGISPSGFNATGESDLRNYYDHIKSKQELKRDAIQTLLNIIQLVEFGEVDPTISFQFNPLDAEDETTETMNFSTMANTLLALLDRGVVNTDEVRQVVRSREAFGLGFLSSDFSPDDEDDEFGGGAEGGLMDMLKQAQGAGDGEA